MPTRASLGFAIVLCVLLLAACSSSGMEEQDRNEEVNVAAAATLAAIHAQATSVPRIAEVTRQIVATHVLSATRGADVTHISELNPTVDAVEFLAPEAAPSSTPQQVTPPPSVGPVPLAGWKVSEFAKGNAEYPYPGGEPGKISVVYQDICVGQKQTVCLAARNNTSEPVALIYGTGVARLPDGSMFAVGEALLSFEPKYVMPSELAFGWIAFNVDLPANAQFELELEARQLPAASNAHGDLLVREVSLLTDSSGDKAKSRVIGQLENITDKRVTRPIQARVMCFSEDGSWDEYFTFPTNNEVDPGQKIPFQIELRGPCPSYLVLASGDAW